jgi:anti-sigma factor ChrR (cupin superfamily)
MADAVYAGLIAGGWHDLPFEYFRKGVEVHWLLRGGAGEPSAALLKYEPGASVPLHCHRGLETILVLEGSQSDEYGEYAEGSLVFNARGTQHSVQSWGGCVVFIQWELPVMILGEDQ